MSELLTVPLNELKELVTNISTQATDLRSSFEQTLLSFQ